MWSTKSRIREDEALHRERTTARLRSVGAAKRTGTDDPEQVRARLERMKYGTNRGTQSSECPA